MQAVLGLLLALLAPAFAHAGEGRPPSVVFVDQAVPAWPRPIEPLPQAEVRRRTLGVITAGVGGVALYGATTWWNEGLSGRFQTVREGWFGQGTSDGGADKLGHMHANYVGVRLVARAFEWAGQAPEPALRMAAWTTLGTFLGVELLDAFTPRYKFSAEDAVMNIAGVGLGLLMERNPRLDRLIDLRLLYQPSQDPRLRGGFDPFGDYSGQTYLLVGKASGIERLRHVPVVRYLELAVGYGTRGYDAGPEFPENHSRYVYAGLSLNLGALIDDKVFRNEPRSVSRNLSRGFFEVFQLPGTVALARNRLD